MTKKDISIEIRLTGLLERVFEKDTEKIHYVLEAEPLIVSEDTWEKIKDQETITLTLKQ